METKKEMNACEVAEHMGATISHGINWTWANAFPTHPTSMRFIEWLDANGYEHRGSYPDGEPNFTWSVRFRRA